LEKVEEKFELVEKYNRQKVQNVILLVVHCIRCGVVRLTPTLQPNFALNPQIFSFAATAQQTP